MNTESDLPRARPGKHPARYTLAELLEGLGEGDTLPIDQDFENTPPVGKEVI